MKNMTVLIKPVSSSCNMRCRYCFYHDVARHRQTANLGMMNETTMKLLIDRAVTEIDEGGQLTFAFQGGEPTLCGKEFFENFIAYVKAAFAAKSCTASYVLQTNGLLLDDAFCEFLAQENFLLGVSLDGAAEVNDYNRIDTKGKSTFNRVQKSIQRLRRYKVDFNILSVITQRQLHHAESLYKFYERQKFTHVQLIPCIAGFEDDNSEEIPRAQEYGEFLCRMFALWKRGWELGQPISIREFDNFASMVMYKQEPELCSMRGVCSVNLVVEADGSVYPCDFYVLDQWRLGSIYDASFRDLLENEKAKEFVRCAQQLPDGCKNCQWLRWCRGGCRRMREQSETKGNPSIPQWCDAQKVFIPFVLANIPGLSTAIQYYQHTVSRMA
jgi:uncharacterized protein